MDNTLNITPITVAESEHSYGMAMLAFAVKHPEAPASERIGAAGLALCAFTSETALLLMPCPPEEPSAPSKNPEHTQYCLGNAGRARANAMSWLRTAVHDLDTPVPTRVRFVRTAWEFFTLEQTWLDRSREARG